MAEQRDDHQYEIAQRRFILELENGIRFANQEIIHKEIPGLTTESILELAVAIARLRAQYLAAAFKLGSGETEAPGDEIVAALQRKRVAYEEARDAFQALREAIEKGYVDLGLLKETAAPE